MDSKNKTKIYILLVVCLIIILGFWFYSFKLNVARLGSTDEPTANGLNELKNSLFDAFKQNPLNESEPENQNKPLEELTNKIAEEIKNQTNSTSTADWLTYRNEELGFEFKYPREWFWDDTNKTLTNYSQEEADLNGGIFISSFIKIQIDTNPLNSENEKSILDCAKSDEETTIIECENVYINNFKFKKTISHFETLTKGYGASFITIKNNNIYYLSGYLGDDDYNQMSQIESIFNTFKFLK